MYIAPKGIYLTGNEKIKFPLIFEKGQPLYFIKAQ